MATYMTLLSVLLMALISSATPTNISSRNQDLVVAIEEMQTANYFSFVMLINMSPLDLIQGNVTFLMPNDRMLSKITMLENAVADFLLRHSIPLPLLFDHLEHIPTGSIIPTLKPEFMLKISNNGRKNFLLNNVKIISPNICVAGSSIRCHGIDRVLPEMTTPKHNTTIPLPTCSSSPSPVAAPAPPTPLASSRPSLPPPVSGFNLTLVNAPPPTDPNISPQKSGSSQRLSYGGLSEFLTTCATLSVVGISISLQFENLNGAN